jgi:hypothetical protein
MHSLVASLLQLQYINPAVPCDYFSVPLRYHRNQFSTPKQPAERWIISTLHISPPPDPIVIMFKFLSILALLLATAYAQGVAPGGTGGSFSYPAQCSDYANDPEVQTAVSAASFAYAAAAAFAETCAAAQTAAQVAVQAATTALSTASSIAKVTITGDNCIAAEASSASSALAKATADASASAQAAAEAFGKAFSGALAASAACAHASIKVCSCSSAPLISESALSLASAYASASKSASAFSQTCTLYAQSTSQAYSCSQSFSASCGKLCTYCGKGYSKITLNVGGANQKITGSGQVACTAQLHSAGIC